MTFGRAARRALSAAAAVALLAAGGAAQSTRPAAGSSTGLAPPPRSFVLRAALIYPVTADQPGPIERGVLIVRDGRIEAVGRDLPLPDELPLIERPHDVICPGFVSAGSSVAGRHTGPETVSGAYRAADAFDPYADYDALLALGTTTAHLDPGPHRLVSGLGAIVKLGGPPGERLLNPSADICVNLGVFDPPLIVKPPFYASSDVPIEPATRQRPDSRLGLWRELSERIAAARSAAPPPGRFDLHTLAFDDAWQSGQPLRLQAWRAVDIAGALEFVSQFTPSRSAYLVGLTEADRLTAELAAARLPLVLRVDRDFRSAGDNIGPDRAALEPRLETAARIAAAGPQLPLALAGPAGDAREDLRMAAILAVRGGLDPQRALAGITRVPAEILGVDARLGSLAPGKDADFLVLTGPPLDLNTHVRQTYIGGRKVFEAPPPVASQPVAGAGRATVVRAGTIWVGNGQVIHDGSVLLENGKVAAVGQRVPHPPGARLIDAGPEAFVTPGFIDAHGHLGLGGDNLVATPDVPIHRTLAVAGRELARVARAGVTTVLQGPYRFTPKGARMAAVKTWGRSRAELVAREIAGVRFTLRGQDPLGAQEPIRQALSAGKKYDESWKKYEAELAKWKEGGPTTRPKEELDQTAEGPDPISGTWEYTVQGGPLPEPVSGTLVLRLTGSVIDGRLTDPMSGEEAPVSGTLSGNQITLEIDVDTPMGRPTIRATLDREDHAVGKIALGGIELDFQATRTSKDAVEFRVQVRRKKTKDGRPTPPKIDENLEPLRPLLAGRIPAVVSVETAAEAGAALKLFVDEFKVPLVLVGAAEAVDAAEALVARREQVGIVVPREVVRVRARRPYVPAADLSRRGLRIALQSDAEDAARNLPAVALYAVQQGLGGDEALRALTIDAARMYKLDDRVGSLEPGKDADVLIFRGHPFDGDGRLECVLIGGEEVPGE